MDTVFHIAALADIVPSINNPYKYFEANVKGTLNVVKACRKFKIKKIVYTASSSCYGIPKNYPTPENEKISLEYPYAFTKNIGEQLILHWSKFITLMLHPLGYLMFMEHVQEHQVLMVLCLEFF